MMILFCLVMLLWPYYDQKHIKNPLSLLEMFYYWLYPLLENNDNIFKYFVYWKTTI